MDRTAEYVRNRVSRWPPQEQSPGTLAELAEVLTLKKGDELPPQLEVSALNFQPVSEEILPKGLTDNEEDTIVGRGRIVPDRPDFILVKELINFPEIDHDEQAEQLFLLAEQALARFQSYLDEGGLINVLQLRRKSATVGTWKIPSGSRGTRARKNPWYLLPC